MQLIGDLDNQFNEVEYKEKRLRTIYNSSKEFCCVTEQGSGGVAAGECGFSADFFFLINIMFAC